MPNHEQFVRDAKCINCQPIPVTFPEAAEANNTTDATVTANTMTPLAAALHYATVYGWKVFPVPPNTKKSYKSAEHSNGAKWGMTNDPAEIQRDWARWPDAGVGLPTGAENGFWVMEADTHAGHAVDGIASLHALEAEHAPLPQTRMAQSPSGSLHYCFKHPGIDIKIKNSASELAPGVDVRGDGGMIVAPPTRRADGQYRWLNAFAFAGPPPWLLALVVQQPRRPRVGGHYNGVAPPSLIAAAVSVIPNNDLGWEAWNKIGMALWAATDGNDGGLTAFHTFSRKSAKYDVAATTERWERYATSPPTEIGVGTIFWLADKADHNWRHSAYTSTSKNFNDFINCVIAGAKNA
jgi:hypothetical protein